MVSTRQLQRIKIKVSPYRIKRSIRAYLDMVSARQLQRIKIKVSPYGVKKSKGAYLDMVSAPNTFRILFLNHQFVSQLHFESGKGTRSNASSRIALCLFFAVCFLLFLV